MAVPDFPHIFAAYFYRGEFAELLFCHIVNVVDKGLRVVTMKDRFEADRKKSVISCTGLTKVVNGSLPFTPSVEYSKYVEHSNIKEYETDKKM